MLPHVLAWCDGYTWLYMLTAWRIILLVPGLVMFPLGYPISKWLTGWGPSRARVQLPYFCGLILWFMVDINHGD